MTTEILLARFASAAAAVPVDERAVRVDRVPAVGEAWWHGDPYAVRAVSADPVPRVEAVFDVVRRLGFDERVPDGFLLTVRRPAGLGEWDAVVLNVEGGVSGYGRDPDDGDAAAEAALHDAGL
ncbi:MAG: hypothetical protein ACR2N6_07465 [Miltoncostaeaceae bacterium]